MIGATMVSQNNKKVAISVNQTNSVGIQLFSYVNIFFWSNKFAQWQLG